MPDNLVPLVVSSGLGFGVIAGVVSGICYVVIQGFRNTGTPHQGKYGVNNPWQCCICGTHFSENSNKNDTDVICSINEFDAKDNLKPLKHCKYSVCENCNGHACRTTCGQWVHDQGQWLCKQCVLYDLQTKTRIAVVHGNENKSWFKSILTALQPNAVTVRMSKPKIKDKSESVSSAKRNNELKIQSNIEEPSTSTGINIGGSSTSTNTNNEGGEREIVRDFIERLVGAMLGANLDDTPVSRLYADHEYDAIFDRYHGDISIALTELGSALHISIANLPVTGQTPCTAHASLKNIIRRVLRDASNMAILKEPQNEAEPPETTTNRTYEDLLATAILNKVIDNYQTDLRRSSSSSTSSKRSDASKRHKSRKHEEERWRTSINNPDLDTTSVSSVEEWCRSDSSCGSKYVDHMSFTIQQSIEEITTSDDEHSNNHYLHKHNLQSKSSFRNSDKEKDLYHEDWQDNWLFSRKGKGSPKPVPVPMLVPNPSTDFRALIGDRDAEDTTDLSETGSDIEETDSTHDIKSILIDSRTIIGGKNLLEQISTENDDTLIKQKTEINMVEEASKDSGVDEDLVSEARNNILIHETPYAESDSLSSNTEKDMEYTERYASIPRQISKEKKNPMPSPRTSKNSINEQQRDELIQQNSEKEQVEITKSIDLSDEDEDDEDEDKFEEETPIVIKGSYSEKEKEKWKNPVALPNNPYSKENLDKRLSNQSNNDNHLFGRDYYIREAKRAAGGRKKFLDTESNDDESTTESSGHDFNQESLPAIKETPQNNENIFVAIPAIVQEVEEEERDEVTDLESVPSSSRPVSLALSTDSEDIKVYNLETGKVLTYKAKDYAKEIIENSKSPEGTKSFINSNELISPNLHTHPSKFDENQNHSTETNREPIMSISKLNHIINLSADIKPQLKSPTAISKKEFLMQQISYTEPDIEIEENNTKAVSSPPELKDASKKYLQSLVRNTSRNNTNIIDVSTPLISIQDEYDYPKPKEQHQEEEKIFLASPPPSIEIEENVVHNLIEIETEDTSDPRVTHKSCIDLRFIGENKPMKTQLSVDNSLLVSQNINGYANSTPNLNDDTLYSDDDSVKDKKTSDLEELNALPKPSVRDLKKLFDQDKQNNKVTLSRSRSNLTTKPEFNAHRQVHSLTARSLSKEYRRDILPKLQNSTNVNDAIIEKQDVQEENPTIPEKEELIHIPPCRSTIEFFEKLKK